MTHRPTLALALLALASLLTNATHAVNAQKRNAPQKKSGAQKKTPEAAKPDAPKTQVTTTQADGQTPAAHQLEPSILVRWQGRPGINRYRLQLATDEKFEDVVFDQAVEGRQYVVKGLPPGNYFWRVAAAAVETSISFSKPERVTLSESAKGVEVANVVLPANYTAGWRTATGEVARLVPASLRPGGVTDFVGVSSDGRVFAVDGASGISLWTVRFNPTATTAATASTADAKSVAFTPLVIPSQAGPGVVVATAGGVRALRGETGREVWRASLQGRASGGVVADANGDGSADVVIVTQDPERYYVLDGGTGRVLADHKLEGEAVGAPYPINVAGASGVLVSLKKGRVELHGADGETKGEAKIEGDVTTAPLVVSRGQMTFMVVGTDNGLWAFSLPDLKVLGVIKADDDSIRGALSSSDVDGDGAPEVVMVTKRGRVALVNTTDGNVRWSTEGVSSAEAAAFADVNGDGVLDVIVPGGDAFALGFSGRDGSLVMKVEDGRAASNAATQTRPLVAAQSMGSMMLVGGDLARMGIRALELPKGAASAKP
ncbi:MAG TPA: PQQ-binding-like beta-propeller repeat protein [Pyrinomonadaceae bacterium]|jgi:outer membrane protein assembly factor BamB|nr:PQQ-binding-like beta-propeller repeat protein [Pyrinomonadaceae bacterium]